MSSATIVALDGLTEVQTGEVLGYLDRIKESAPVTPVRPRPKKRRRYDVDEDYSYGSDEDTPVARALPIIFTPRASPVKKRTSSTMKVVCKARSKKISHHLFEISEAEGASSEANDTARSQPGAGSARERPVAASAGYGMTCQEIQRSNDHTDPSTRRAKLKATQSLHGSYSSISGKPLFPEHQENDSSDDEGEGRARRQTNGSGGGIPGRKSLHELQAYCKEKLDAIPSNPTYKKINQLLAEGELMVASWPGQMCSRCQNGRSPWRCVYSSGAGCIPCLISHVGCEKKTTYKMTRQDESAASAVPAYKGALAVVDEPELVPLDIERRSNSETSARSIDFTKQSSITPSSGSSSMPLTPRSALTQRSTHPELNTVAGILEVTSASLLDAAGRMRNLACVPLEKESYLQRLHEERRALEQFMAFVPVVLSSMEPPRQPPTV